MDFGEKVEEGCSGRVFWLKEFIGEKRDLAGPYEVT